MDGLKPSRLLVDLSSGLLAGAMTLTISVSMAALIFSGPAAAFLPLGIGMALICAVVFLWGGRFFQYFPVALIGGYLLYIGLSFLYRWLFKRYFHLRKNE